MNDDNSLCEICYAHYIPDNSMASLDLYWINQHCIDLRRNRETRKNKNYKPTKTVF